MSLPYDTARCAGVQYDIIDAIGQPETAEVAARMRAVIAKAKGEA